MRSPRPLFSSSGVRQGPCGGSGVAQAKMSGAEQHLTGTKGAGEIYYISDDEEEEATSGASNGDDESGPK